MDKVAQDPLIFGRFCAILEPWTKHPIHTLNRFSRKVATCPTLPLESGSSLVLSDFVPSKRKTSIKKHCTNSWTACDSRTSGTQCPPNAPPLPYTSFNNKNTWKTSFNLSLKTTHLWMLLVNFLNMLMIPTLTAIWHMIGFARWQIVPPLFVIKMPGIISTLCGKIHPIVLNTTSPDYYAFQRS